jgi:hypothetical protein
MKVELSEKEGIRQQALGNDSAEKRMNASTRLSMNGKASDDFNRFFRSS